MTLDPNPVPTGCSRSEVVAALRRALPRLEGFSAKALPLGVPAIDRYLPQGGLAFGAVHEIGPESASDTGAAFGFVLSLLARMPREGPVLLVVSPRGLARCGRPYGRGLNALGLDPARVLLVEAANERDALWAIEEALRSGAPTAVDQKPMPTGPAAKPSGGDQAATGGDRKDPLVGLPVFGSDGRKVGDVEQVKAAPDGKLEEIHIRTGGFLGFGSRMVAIPAGKFVRSGTNVQVSMTSSDVSALPAVDG